jgi:LacI family transcriptional regulator
MKDIARDLGISVVAVSKALHNQSDIGEETRQRVLRRAEELNYQPNWAARSLISGRTYSIGLVVPDLLHPFFAEVAKGIAHQIRLKGYHLIISSCEENPKLERENVGLMVRRQVDALVLASAISTPDTYQMCEERGIPCLLLDRRFPEIRCHYVGTDDVQVGLLACEHLINCGCRIVAHIRGPEISTGIGRFEGYRRALVKHRLRVNDTYVVLGRSADDAADSSGYEAMLRLLRMKPRPDGVFCYNDAVAVGAIDAILESGLRIPQDVAVIGVGNMRWVDKLRVPLSSVDQSAAVIGERAAELALNTIESNKRQPPQTVLIPSTLVPRESTQKPN